MRLRARWFAAPLIVALSGSPAAQQRPTFESNADIIPIDANVLDGQGRPVQGLVPADFTVRIDGQPRRVVSAEWIPLTTRGAAAPAVAVPEGYSSNEQSTAGRLIVIAIDQPNIPFTAVRPMQDTLSRFVDGLEATDRIAVIGFGTGAPSISFTT